MNAYPESMNLTTAAKYLGTSSVEIRRMLKEQKIPASKIRGRWILHKALLDDWRLRNSASTRAGRSKAAKKNSHSSSNPVHPSVARLLATLDKLDFSGLDPADWDNAKKHLAEEETRRTHELIALAERGE